MHNFALSLKMLQCLYSNSKQDQLLNSLVECIVDEDTPIQHGLQKCPF